MVRKMYYLVISISVFSFLLGKPNFATDYIFNSLQKITGKDMRPNFVSDKNKELPEGAPSKVVVEGTTYQVSYNSETNLYDIDGEKYVMIQGDYYKYRLDNTYKVKGGYKMVYRPEDHVQKSEQPNDLQNFKFQMPRSISDVKTMVSNLEKAQTAAAERQKTLNQLMQEE